MVGAAACTIIASVPCYASIGDRGGSRSPLSNPDCTGVWLELGVHHVTSCWCSPLASFSQVFKPGPASVAFNSSNSLLSNHFGFSVSCSCRRHRVSSATLAGFMAYAHFVVVISILIENCCTQLAPEMLPNSPIEGGPPPTALLEHMCNK